MTTAVSMVDGPVRFGDYEIVRPIAQGGMGVVYRAQHTQTREVVALKTVVGVQGAMLAGLRREIRALRRMKHPGVVPIFAEGVEQGLPWYAMELLNGQTLRGHHLWSLPSTNRQSSETVVATPPAAEAQTMLAPLLPHEGEVDDDAPIGAPLPDPASVQSTLVVMRRVCDALAYVHGAGLIHRDLKPENIFVREDGRPVLVDFGLAAAYQGATSREVLDVATRILGSPGYMAPEQIRGDLVDARADLYAVGCILFEAVSGRLPFDGKIQEIISGHLNKKAPRLADVAPNTAPELDKLVAQLLAKRPQDRLPYADDVSTVLLKLGAIPPGEAWPSARSYLYRPRLAGREPIIEELRHVLSKCAEGRGARVLLGGESGVGKTRVAIEIAKEASRLGLRIVTGECSPIASKPGKDALRAAPFHPLKQLLLSIVDRCNDRCPAEAERLLGDSATLLATLEPQFADFVSGDHAPLHDAEPAAMRYRLLEAIAETLSRFAGRSKLLLVIDDLQWADDGTLELLSHLDESYLARTSIVVLCTYRSEEVSPQLAQLRLDPGIIDLQLGRLDADGVRSMVHDMLALPMPPRAFVDRLVEATEGNPFFIAEYLRASVENGFLSRDDRGRWTPENQESDEIAGLAFPDSLRSLVEERLYSLSATGLQLARLASVLGRVIDEQVLRRSWKSVATQEDAEAWDELIERFVIEPAEGGEFRFVHDKLRETAYSTIDQAERRRNHKVIATSLEAQYPDNGERDNQCSALGHHYELAGEFESALAYLDRAGEHALSTGSSVDAASSFEASIRISDAHPSATNGLDVAKRRRRLGLAQYNLGLLDAALDNSERALEQVLPSGVRRLLVRRANGPFAGLRAGFELVGQLLSQLGVSSGRVHDELASAHREGSQAAETLSQLYYFRNEAVLATACSLLAANLAEPLGSSRELGRSYAGLGAAAALIPSFALSDRYLSRAEKAGKEINDPSIVSWTLFVRAFTRMGYGQFREAEETIERLSEVATQTRDVRRTEELTALLSNIRLFQGRIQDSLGLVIELERSARKSRNHQALLWATSGRAECAVAFGRADEAIAHFQACEPLVEKTDLAQQASIGQISEAYLQLGDLKSATDAADKVLDLVVGQMPTAHHCIHAYRALGDVSFAVLKIDGSSEAARSRARRTTRLVRGFARVYDIARPMAAEFEGLLDFYCGDREKGLKNLRAAVVEAERFDMPLERGRVLLALGSALGSSAPERGGLLDEALRIFETAGASYLAGKAEAELRRNESD